MSPKGSELPLVSVVVPAFKHEAFIATALQSVFDQDYQSIELIVIDDASPDGTARKVAEWAASPAVRQRFHRFLFLNNASNLGAHGSINRGCAAAEGEYIAVLNSDDVYHPTRLRCLVDALRAQGGHLAFSRVAPIDDSGRLVSPAALPPELIGVFELAGRAAANLPSLRYAFTKCNIAISTGNFVFSRQLYGELGPFSDLKYVHDWDFALRSTLHAEPVYVPEDLYFYRVHSSNSFSALGHVADFETRVVYARFRAASRASTGASFACQQLVDAL